MFPTIFSYGPVAVSTLGALSFWAFLSGTFIFWRKGKEEGLEEEKLLDWAFLGVLAGIFTGRIGFILDQWPRFGLDFNAWFDFQQKGGFSFVGAVSGALFVLWLLSKRSKWDFWAMADIAVFSLIWAGIWVRLGQVLSGIAMGKQTDFYFPVQLLEIGFLIFLFFFLKKLEKQYRLFTWYQDKRGEASEGFLFLVYLLFYSVFRFLLAFASESHLYFLSIAFSQWVAVVGFGGALLLFAYKTDKLEQVADSVKKLSQKVKREEREVLLSKAPKPRSEPSVKDKRRIKTGSDVK